jgi:hypothetical protein
MINLEKHHIYITVGVIVFMVLLWFLLTWYVKKTVKHELRSELKELNKERKKRENKAPVISRNIQYEEPNLIEQQEIDSYIEPNYNVSQGDMHKEPKRLSKDEIGMRDILNA